MLLALLREDDGVAHGVFRDLGIKTDEVAKTILGAVQPGRQGVVIPAQLPYTSRAKKALELAMNSARDLQHGYVGTEHLLLGLLREKTGIAAQALNQAGLTESAARDEVVRVVGQPKAEGTPGPVVSVKLQIQVKDGTAFLHESFPDVESAIAFLRRFSSP
jgi:ATP-dependent Clp protease ATP-binding subunit ClpC